MQYAFKHAPSDHPPRTRFRQATRDYLPCTFIFQNLQQSLIYYALISNRWIKHHITSSAGWFGIISRAGSFLENHNGRQSTSPLILVRRINRHTHIPLDAFGLSIVQVPVTELIPCIDVTRFRPSTVGSRGVYMIPPASISLTISCFHKADLM